MKNQEDKERIIVVTGFGRSGCGAMMQMLRAGGIELHVNEGDMISCESDDTMGLPSKTAWLDGCAGKAVKVLDIQRFKLPDTHAYDFVVMKRKPEDCGISHVKMMRAVVGHAMGESDALNTAGAIAQNWQPMIDLLASYTGSRMLIVEFSEMVSQPLKTATRLAKYFRKTHDLDTDRMCSAIVPRTTGVYRGLLEVQLLAMYESLQEALLEQSATAVVQ